MGDYDWFYEGFTNYQALRASQRLGELTFGDYLDALARTSDAYDALKAQDTVSLLEASSRRWTGSNALVYHKGMLVAALYDLRLRSATGGKRSLDDVYRALYRSAQTGSRGRDGNSVVLGALEEAPFGREFTDRFIRGVQKVDLPAELQAYGLRLERAGGRSRVTVSNSLRGSQRDLLRQIGYNK
jgi:predicted metalloprotease with PDZ domain